MIDFTQCVTKNYCEIININIIVIIIIIVKKVCQQAHLIFVTGVSGEKILRCREILD